MRIITYLISLLVAVFLSACGGGGGSPGLPSVEKTPITSTAPAELVLAVGASSTSYALIGGVYPYKAVTSSNTQVATAVLGDRTFWIGGISSGTSTITITDSAGQILSIALTVENLGKFYTTAPGALTMTPGSSTRVYEIGGGQPGYTVFSDNLDVAVVDGSSGSVLKITPKKVGTANIVVSDSATPTKSTVTIAVTVKSLFDLVVSPTDVTTFVAMPTEFYVTGGTPPYRLAGSIPAALSVTPLTGVADPTTFVVTGSLVGKFDVVFIDSQNVEKTVTLTVQDGSPVIRMSPSSLTISEKDLQSISLTFYGATPGNVFSSDLTLVTVPANPLTTTVFTVKPTGKCVNGDQDVTITVVDANKSITSSVITIKDNGNVEAVAGDNTVDPPIVAVKGSDCPPVTP